MARRKAPSIPDELLDQLLAGRDPGSALTAGGVLDELKRAFAERALNAEMDHHLAEEAGEGGENRRNGYGRKTLVTETGKLPITVPRDRLATFDPQLFAHEMEWARGAGRAQAAVLTGGRACCFSNCIGLS
jgi:putative transposase